MSNDYKKETRKQYLHYFRFWFIVIVVLAVVAVICTVLFKSDSSEGRSNYNAPAERVYDYADVLTDDEEEMLRSQIAEAQERLRMDIVIVTIYESVEGEEADAIYGSPYWELNMETLADDFWDENGFGYNKDFEGDGILLLHNWYEGQNGEHLSSSGKAEQRLSVDDIDRIIDPVSMYYGTDPYKAYSKFVDEAVSVLGGSRYTGFVYWLVTFLIATVTAFIYAFAILKTDKAKNTTTASTYVAGGKPVMRVSRDDFIRKHVATRHVPRDSGSSGGSSGGGGHHTSSSGASHGGGSRRN